MNQGREAEERVARLLEERGYRILHRNLRAGRWEADIVAWKDGLYVFVEVKARTGRGFGSPGEAVTREKRRRLEAVARSFLAGRKGGSCRFDVALVSLGKAGVEDVVILEDAFRPWD